MNFEIALLSSKLATPTMYKQSLRTKCEMATVKHLFLEFPGVHRSLEKRVNITLQYLKNTDFQHTAQIKTSECSEQNGQVLFKD